MKKILLSLLVILTLPSFSFAQSSIPSWKITEVEKYMNSGKDEVLIINFWATFCKPCIAEIPAFIHVAGSFKDKNVKLLLVSLDLPSFYPKKIADFATKNKWQATIVWLNETNADYFCPKIDPKWSGSIPATLIINPKTGYRKFFEEEIGKEELEKAVKEGLGDLR